MRETGSAHQTAAALLVFVLGSPAVAVACSCPWPDPPQSDWPEQSPSIGAVDVPTDAVLLISVDSLDREWMLVSDDVTVALEESGRVLSPSTASTVSFQFRPSLGELVPVELLAPDRTWSLIGTDAIDDSGARGWFTTGSGPAEELPSPPELTGEELAAGTPPAGLCGCSTQGRAEFRVSNDAPWLFASTWESPIWGDTDYLNGGLGRELEILGQPDSVRFAAMDYAGQLSGWSEPEVLAWPPAGCGCSNAGPPATAWWLLAPMLGLVLRRRS